MAFLNRKKKGYGWLLNVNQNKKFEKVPDGESKLISIYFTKDHEPDLHDLNEKGSYKGDFYFQDTTGAMRKAWFYIDDYYHEIAILLGGKENEYVDPEPSWQPKTETVTSVSSIKTEPKWDMKDSYQTTLDGSTDEEYWKKQRSEIKQDDLPFY